MKIQAASDIGSFNDPSDKKNRSCCNAN